MNSMQKRKIFVVGILLITACCIWIFTQSEEIRCTPNLDDNTIIIESRNACISKVTTKYGHFVLLSEDCDQCILSVDEYGAEYIRVDYTDEFGHQKFTVFEVVISSGNLVTISQFNELGTQIDYSAY